MKMKYIGYVVKLFKIVTSSKEEVKPIMDIINIWYNNVCMKGDDIVDCVSINYGSKKWQTLKGFSNFLHNKTQDDICELFISCKQTGNCFFYLKALNNEMIKKESGIEEFYLSFNSEHFIDIESFKSLINKIYRVFKLDYAYAFALEKNIDIVSEKKVVNHWFSKSVSINQHDLNRERKMIEIKEGYIPKLYKYNVFNKRQLLNLETIKKNPEISLINEQLVFYIDVLP